MKTRIVIVIAFFATTPLAAFGEDKPTKQVAPELKSEVVALPALTLAPATYTGPGGQTIQLKQALPGGGKVSDLAAKGIIIIDNKPTGKAGDESAKGIIIIDNKPADGTYTAPDGTSFLVQRGIIIVDNKPGDTEAGDLVGPID